MAPSPPPYHPSAKDARIAIVGAGIFGLSTALHLARRGYDNVTLFDAQPYHETLYSYATGCDAASADINKIFRCAYGSQKEYMRLSLESREEWLRWNEELASGDKEDIPKGMRKGEKVFIANGNLSLTDERELPTFEIETVKGMEEAGWEGTQLVTMQESDTKLAAEKGMAWAIDPFLRRERRQPYLGVLDTLGGTTVADRACRLALHKVQSAGVKIVFGKEKGTFVNFMQEDGMVVGLRTRDGNTHTADRVIMACGGWTPSLVPSLDDVCETTCGSVVMIRIPNDSPLMQRYSPENFPTWTWNVRAGLRGGLYGFAVNEDGLLKIGYRGEKYYNPEMQEDGKERSVPLTRWTENEQITSIPRQSWEVIKQFIMDWMPDLLEEEGVKVEMSRLCWYNDSWDNHFVIDWVPGQEGRVMVATAGSGHAFKYTPIIGRYVADILESKGSERDIVQKWRWRKQTDAGFAASDSPITNSLMEGSAGSRVLKKQKLLAESSLRLADQPRL
jgi:sarcosine oxidase / L-pipecolate oxidase